MYALRFEDLLRGEDWVVRKCTKYYDEVNIERAGSDVAVVHRSSEMNLWVFPINGILWNSDIFSPYILNGFTRSERKKLSSFARDVIRNQSLMSALIAEESVKKAHKFGGFP